MSNLAIQLNPMRLKAVLLGDTSLKNRHGPQRSMENLQTGLAENGIEVIASHSGRRWQSETWISQAIRLADLVIVNGSHATQENRPILHDFLAAGEFAVQQRVPAFLINAVWAVNDPILSKRAATFQRIYVQESASQSDLSNIGLHAKVVPNLIFARGCFSGGDHRHGLLATDASHQHTSQVLHRLITSTNNGTFAPEVSSAWSSRENRVPKQLKRHRRFQQLVGQLFGTLGLCPVRYLAQASAVPTSDDYLEMLQRAEAILTGRYHATCFAMLTQTPFLAIDHHTTTTSAMLQDAGLSSERMITQSQLRRSTLAHLRMSAFRKQEMASLTAYLADAERSIAEMFREMASLCRGERPQQSAA